MREPRVVPCPHCARKFADANAVYQHGKSAHRLPARQNPKPRRPDDDEESMADRMIYAQLQQAMGGPVDEDWLLDCL